MGNWTTTAPCKNPDYRFCCCFLNLFSPLNLLPRACCFLVQMLKDLKGWQNQSLVEDRRNTWTDIQRKTWSRNATFSYACFFILRGNVQSSYSNTVLWSYKSMQLYLHNSTHSLRLACFAGKVLDQMNVRGPVQPKLLCDFIRRMWHRHTKSSAPNILKYFSGELWMPQLLLLSATLSKIENHHTNYDHSRSFSWGSGSDNSLLKCFLLV